MGAYGRYRYDGSRFERGQTRDVRFNGEVSFLSAQLGYQLRRGKLTVKGFAGLEAIDQQVTPFDPNNSVQGSKLGARLTLETWMNLSERWFLCADVSYGTAFQEYWQLTRIGYRWGPVLSIGLEGGVLGNQEYDAGRGGAFLRAKLKKFEATMSGGFTGDYLLSDPSGYLSLNIYRPF